MKNYVLGFIFNDKNQVLLMTKLAPEWQIGLLNGIGGKIEPEEMADVAIAREASEEINCPPLEWNLAGLIIGSLGADWSVMVYCAEYNGEITAKEREQVDWYDCHNLPENIINNLNWLVPMCKNRLTNKGFTFTTSEQ